MDKVLIKWDLLGIDACQKIHICLDLLLEDGYIEWQGSLKETYEKYRRTLHVNCKRLVSHKV